MPLTSTTTTTVTTTSVNQGFQLQVDTDSSTKQIGNFVTDVSIQPYIADQTISFRAFNVRPGTRLHIFFDGVNVDEFCAPGFYNPDGVTNATTKEVDYSDPTIVVPLAKAGTPIFSRNDGTVAGVFYVPKNKFRTGERVLEIADVDSLDAGKDAMTTMASATFVASNLSVTKQIMTLTTVNPVLNYIPVTNTIVKVDTFVTTEVQPDIYNITQYHWEPVAQTLTINTPNGEAGVFATSIDLFFEQGSQGFGGTDNGCLIYLCEMDNGYPNGASILPFSLSHLRGSELKTSADASIPTKFKFESPVFLANGKDYAFIVKPDNNDPDIRVYSANLGNIDITTGVQVTSQPVIGTAFYGATVKQWTALQSEYIKFKLNVAEFQQSEGTAVFVNTDDDYLGVVDLQYANSTYVITPGDIVYQATNSYADEFNKTTANTSISGVVEYFDDARNLLYLTESTGNFRTTVFDPMNPQQVDTGFVQIHRFGNGNTATWIANSSTLIASANVFIVYNPKVNAVVPEFASIAPPGTAMSFTYSGTTNTHTVDSTDIPVTLGYERELYDYERLAMSKSMETRFGTGKSTKVKATLKSDTPFLSPVLDTVKSNILAIRNYIDPIMSVYEEFYDNSASRTKYISKAVTLADGQDAEDLQIILSAYRPYPSDVQVWVRFKAADDTEPLQNKIWTPMVNKDYALFSDPTNTGDYREYTYDIPKAYPLLNVSGKFNSVAANGNIEGVGTVFEQELREGWYVNVPGEKAKKILTIANNEFMVLDSGFTSAYSQNNIFIVPPPAAAYLSVNTSIQLPETTATVSTTTNMVVRASGSADFTTYFAPGSIVDVGGDSQVVVSVINSTALTVGTNWTSDATGNIYSTASDGLTYISSTGSRFTSFKQFQIKIILQSNDSSKVPNVDNMRALAIQL